MIKTERIPVVAKKYNSNFKKNRDVWVWFIASILALAGLALIIVFSKLLHDSYKKENGPYAAYSGAIGAGLAAIIACVTQILVFIHRKSDEKQKKLKKAEHDYTNFFIKNFDLNELILNNLEVVTDSLLISYEINSATGEMFFKYNAAYNDIRTLTAHYIAALVKEVSINSEFGNMLIDKYKLNTKDPHFYNKLFSCIDTEIKRALGSMEKILLNYENDQYDDEYYSYNIKKMVPKFLKCFVPYIVLIISNNSVVGVDNYSYIIYSISKGEK